MKARKNPMGNGSVPLIGQSENTARNVFASLYLNLIPVVTAKRLDTVSDWGEHADTINADQIADEAWEIANVALKKLGFPNNTPARSEGHTDAG